jgi:hypothetical protein
MQKVVKLILKDCESKFGKLEQLFPPIESDERIYMVNEIGEHRNFAGLHDIIEPEVLY